MTKSCTPVSIRWRTTSSHSVPANAIAPDLSLLRALIVGGDSMIGRALVERIRCSGGEAAGTTRRGDAAQPLFADLGTKRWNLDGSFDVAIICAAVARFADCSRDPAASRGVNVDGVVSIATELASRGSRILFVSTNSVFDGSVPRPLARDNLAPVTEYGKQKAET